MSVTRVYNRYYVFGISDCGKSRYINEDAILLNGETGVFLLADGMGGHGNGDVASAKAVNTVDALFRKHFSGKADDRETPVLARLLASLFKKKRSEPSQAYFIHQSQLIADILQETNRTIHRCNRENGMDDGCGMGTTIVGCRLVPDTAKMQIFHVGDSRLYLFRDNALSQITEDHSLSRQWLDGGQIGEKPANNQLYQAMGPKSAIQPDVAIFEICPGDGFLLCSDGLTNMLEDSAIAAVLYGLDRDNIEAKARSLIDGANANGGVDNISVILICQ